MSEVEAPSALTFPCEFPIKAMGKSSPELDLQVVEIVCRHVSNLREGAVSMRPSKGGKYTSITVTIEATSKQQLDAIYQDLTDCPAIIMAL
jgi:putative lipoic acid-binding regulatory protein